MELVNPFALEGHWYKGNLHAHTTNSDGEHSPEETVEIYRGAGYDFLALTDHWVVTEAVSPADDFLLIPGVEFDGDRSEIGESHHVLCFGLTQGGPLPEERTMPAMLAWIREHGGVSVLAHPYWSGLTYRDLIGWDDPIGIEVFNTVCEGMIAKGHSSVQWDDLLSRGKLCWGLAVDDCHSRRSATYASVRVKAPALTQEAIVAALRAGSFYSTNGPRIEEVVVEAEQVYVRTSPVREINFMSRSWLGRQFRAAPGETITEATFTFRGTEPYLRIECCDPAGWRAWTNPVFFRAE